MVRKAYNWTAGARLQEHSRSKHRILRKYVHDYLTVRCKLPHQGLFRLAIVDGFAGAGRYSCGSAGSPLIFMEELKQASEVMNTFRADQGLKAIEIECLLVFNDTDRNAISLLKEHAAPLLAGISDTCPRLHLHTEYLNDEFESAYPIIKALLAKGRYRNVLFSLDQYGHSHVRRETILDIMQSYPSAEVFHTFAITSLLAFLQRNQPEKLREQLGHLGLNNSSLDQLDGIMTRQAWLGTAERIVFDTFRSCATYVSPFSINNPGGWRYWLIHFANSYRARQVYNDVLHDNASLQAHFGRSGLDMLHYDPGNPGQLYLFDANGRESARDALSTDIPQLVSDLGDTMSVEEFYKSSYNNTVAHFDDIHDAIIENPDLEVLTPGGGERRKAGRIRPDDTIRLTNQRSLFFPKFLRARK